jgi:3-phosphoshikimate 1-carboxyvinyltransferase
MHDLTLSPCPTLRGSITVPGDKSISHRYVLLAALAEGDTRILGLAPGADVAASLACMGHVGATISRQGDGGVTVVGLGAAGLRTPVAPLDCMNSGTTMRLLAGIMASYPVSATLIGDASLSRRPMRRVLAPLEAMGARVESHQGRAPIAVHGGALSAITWTPEVPSAQIKSAILLAGLRAAGRTVVHEPAPTRDHSERAFPLFGLHTSTVGLDVAVEGGQRPIAPKAPVTVPGDPSSAAVWAVAAAGMPGAEVILDHVCLNPHRLGFVAALRRMGADVTMSVETQLGGEPVGQLRVVHRDRVDTVISPDEVPGLIDELPILAACAAHGRRLEVRGAAELRVKESDRITALVTGLRALGVSAEEFPDGFAVDGRAGRPTGGEADASGDHRLVMAFTLVALGASRPTRILDAGAVAVSYPSFTADLARLQS